MESWNPSEDISIRYFSKKVVNSFVACERSSKLKTENCWSDLATKQSLVTSARGHWRPLSSPRDVLTGKRGVEAEINKMINVQVSNLERG